MRDLRRTASISSDGSHCYRLGRTWDAAKPKLGVVTLLPGRSDAMSEQNALMAIMRRVAQMGYGGVEVVPLFSRRDLNAGTLNGARRTMDGRADAALAALPADVERVLAGWGNLGEVWGRSLPRWREAVDLICGDAGADLWSLGLTVAGQPRDLARAPKRAQMALWHAGAEPAMKREA